ncbi:MAG: CotH kinase family protein [Lachnospiraceae bacterium]|nr:CotH kinase family protein [Lachnospiraceae bacterium]
MNRSRKYILFISVIVLIAISLFFFVKGDFRTSDGNNNTVMDNITFYRGEAKGIRLSPAPVDGVYNLFVPGCGTKSLYISCPSSLCLVLNDQVRLSDGDDIMPHVTDISDEGNLYAAVKVLSSGDREVFNGYINFFLAGELPSVHITVPGEDIKTINSENPEESTDKLHTTGMLTIVDPDGAVDCASEIDMSRRGNTSFLHMDVKPYNINLKRPMSVLGMRTAGKYALKANSYDMNHLLRNEAALDMSRATGMPVTCDSRFADVYINGEYNGLYMITNRIKGDELIGLGGDGYLLELDYRYETEDNYFVSHDQGIVVHYPEYPSEEKMEYIEALYNKAYEAIETDGDYESFIDVDSFMKMYLIQDFFCNVDVDYASFYFFLGDDGLFHAGPVWDFDLTDGIMQTLPFHEELARRSHIVPDRGGIFLDLLDNSPRFRERVREYYLNEFSPIVEEYAEGLLLEKGRYTEKSLKISDINNSFSFKGFHSLESAQGLSEWILERDVFLKSFYEAPEEYVNVRFHFAWGDIRTLAKKGEALGYLPDSAHPDNDDSFWGEITGFEMAGHVPADEGFIPTEDTDLYAVYPPDAHAWAEGYAGTPDE